MIYKIIGINRNKSFLISAMRKLRLILSFTCLCFIVNAQSKINVLSYQYKIELNDKNDTIKGVAGISFQANETITSFSFDLSGLNKNQKGMIVKHINFNDSNLSLQEFKQENDKVVIKCQPIQKGDVKSVVIDYNGIPSDGLIISKNKYGERTFFADNWPNRAHNWIPCVDDPADKASVEFIITAPSHYQVISNGIQIEESNLPGNKKITHWKEDTPLSTKIMVIGVADFAIKKFPDSPENIPVSAWIYRRDSTNGFIDFAPAPAILKFLSDYIGPYPYKKLANVQSKTIFGGMENAGAIFYSEDSVTGKNEDERLLAHEITHQWFGDMATEKSFAHLWLSEGFATYFTHIYIESKYGTDRLNNEMQTDRNEVIEFAKVFDRPVVDFITPWKGLLNTNSYEKGSWILHMLRRQLGDSVFHQIIRSYYNTYKGKNADTEDFKNIAEKVSGKNLETFFRQWLFTPGVPQLEINWTYLPKEKKISVKVIQLQTELFQFPFDIAITTTKSKIEKIMISKRSETFTFPVKDKPAKVLADPFTSLLFEGIVTELKYKK
jgi:aminopeptidase N